MPALITPTTELEAVNECLENIGQAPVSTITGDLGVDTQIALNFVRKSNRALQSKGWYWNTDKDYPLEPDENNDILLPANTLSVRPSGTSLGRQIVQRGQRLYDRENFTYSFTEKVYVELTTGLTFEELPETARRYISLNAARIFQNRIEGGSDQDDLTDEALAMADLMADQLRIEKSNALTDNASTYGTVQRRSTDYFLN
jgi:hypothetical protein